MSASYNLHTAHLLVSLSLDIVEKFALNVRTNNCASTTNEKEYVPTAPNGSRSRLDKMKS